MPTVRPMLGLIPIAVLLLPRPATAQERATNCEEFFAQVEAEWGLPPVIQTCEGVVGLSSCIQNYINNSSLSGHFQAVDVTGITGSSTLDPVTVQNERPFALCSDNSFPPPHVTVEEGSKFAIFNAKWRLPEQGQLEDGLRTFIDSAGGRVIVMGSALDAEAVEGSGETALVRIRNSADGVDLRDVYVEGDPIPNLTLVRQEKTNPEDTFSGSIDLTRIAWQNLGDKAALYRPVCTDADGGVCPVAAPCETFSITVSDSEFNGSGGDPTLDDYFVRSTGSLVVSGTTLQDITFSRTHALKAAGDLRLEAGTALLELRGYGDVIGPIVAYSAQGEVVANTVLAADLSGWDAILASRWESLLEQSYVCGVTDSVALLYNNSPGDTAAKVVSSAIVGARLDGGLIATEGQFSSQASLNNVLVLNVSDPDGGALAPVEVSAEGTVSSILRMTNVLVSDSALDAGDTFDEATADAVRLYGTACGDLGIEGEDEDCAVLSAAPAFTSGERLRSPSSPTCAITSSSSPNFTDFANLMRAEAAVDAAVAAGGDVDTTELEALTETLRSRLPALYADQTELVGAGSEWSGSEDGCGSAVPPELDDIGAHGGTCSLSFLAPVERDAEVDPDPDPDTAEPGDPDHDTGEDGAPAEAGRFGLGSGCRYGGAALILPLAVAIRRRRRRADRT